MKKVLFITLIAVVFILASCTLAPFNYLFGGGGFIGGGGTPTKNEGELILDFSDFAFSEAFLRDVSFFVIDIFKTSFAETKPTLLNGKISFTLNPFL